MLRQFILALGALMISTAALAGAQARLTGGDLSGTVTDEASNPIPGTFITVVNLDTNLSRESLTDGTGRFRIPALSPGTYRVLAAVAGFRRQVREPVDLLLGQTVTLDFVLTLEATTDVTVTGRSSSVATTGAELSSVVTQHQIDVLPVNGRNFIGFAALTPGVSLDKVSAQGVTATSGLSFTGQRGRSNNIMVDGFDNNDPVMGSVRAAFSQEAVREFQVLTDSYSAEFGKASGGVINIVTKGGTNVTHGNTFLYFRNRALNARSYFERFDVFGRAVALNKTQFEQKQWGATFGGPLRTDRTFLFLSYERSDLTDGRTVTIDRQAADALRTAGFPVALGDVPLHARHAELFGKVDHHWTPTRSVIVSGHHSRVNREGIDDFGGIVARSRGTVQHRTDWALSAAETDILSSRWLNEARVQYSRENQRVEALDPLCGGPCHDVNQGGPTIELAGVAAVGRQRSSPQLRLIKRTQWLDTVSFLKFGHQFKAGVEFNHLFLPHAGNALPATFGGRYVFAAIPALGLSSALDAFQKGVPAAYVQGYGNPFFPEETYNDLSVFAQDEWQRGRLILKPGVRYQRQFWQELTIGVSDLRGTSFGYDLPSDRNNVAPRLAALYDVHGDARLRLRVAYGLFYDNIVLSVQNVGRLVTGGLAGVRTLVLSYPNSVTAWNSPEHRLTESQATALVGGSYPSLVVVPAPNLTNSYTHQTSIGVDRTLNPTTTLSVSGMFLRGFGLPGPLDYNPTLPGTLGPGRRPNDTPCSVNPAALCINGGIPGTSAPVLQFTPFGQSWYRGITVSASGRPGPQAQWLLSYTLSKAEDIASDFQSSAIPQTSGYGRNPADRFGVPLGFDPASERGPAALDQRHRLVASGGVQIPWRLELSGIVAATSGRPFSPLAGTDLNGDGDGGAFPADRARLDPSDPATSVGRNSEATAAQFNVDARLSRKFQIGRRAALQVIVEGFNIFNRANFIEDANPSSFAVFGTGAFPDNPLPTFGKYTLTLPPRQIQLAAKVDF